MVKSGDGSESGWREPHVYFTAEQQVGKRDDVVTLQPGDGITLDDWRPTPEHHFPFKAGQVRLQLHNVYGAKASRGRGGQVTEVPESMKGIPAYHLVSDPVVFEIVD